MGGRAEQKKKTRIPHVFWKLRNNEFFSWPYGVYVRHPHAVHHFWAVGKGACQFYVHEHAEMQSVLA